MLGQDLERAAESKRTLRPINDVDVHPSIGGGMEVLLPYMPRAWQEKIRPNARGGALRPGGGRYLHPIELPVMRDAIPPGGGMPGADPRFVAAQHLDRYNVEHGLLIEIIASTLAIAAVDPDHSAVLVAACNDYILDHWQGQDDRFTYAMTVSPIDPSLAVKEIRRHGKNPFVSAVFLPIQNIRLGNRHYYPIYEAAVEHGLNIVCHPGAGESMFQGTGAVFACGIAERYIERYVEWGQIPWSCISSLIFNGALDRYPDLKFMWVEWGFSWAVPMSWRMDKSWRQLRADCPWVKTWPSEYLRDRFFFSTQPIDEPRREGDLERMIEDYFADNLCFASDYPHWDNDRPDMILKALKPETQQKVYHDNALRFLRLPK
jgi:predicted TIM-barrel fold metal-dependent hydrolase